ncbi:DUF523 domain-containing protein [Notoacmeibacter marinus]|uniref:DUF523 domain-containing protein n=1 Tax=Notoacmeibacter marinus TaxID=1876515 RepID=UPI000DF1366F|nr:DUF523 domain-containing protein [Notoacmeibacter marinus]
MDRILVSACLLGRPVRYNGKDKLSGNAILSRWQGEGRVVSICPEVAVGFPTPRPPAEIVPPPADGPRPAAGAMDPEAVSSETIAVVEKTGRDVTALYVKAARDTVATAQRMGCRYAVLTDGSPSCGSTFIYDGTFSGNRIDGMGVTTAALRAAGIEVWPETRMAELDERLRS